jgi:hypothetical protein
MLFVKFGYFLGSNHNIVIYICFFYHDKPTINYQFSSLEYLKLGGLSNTFLLAIKIYQFQFFHNESSLA